MVPESASTFGSYVSVLLLGHVHSRALPAELLDVLLVDGNPLEDLKVVTERSNLKIIMKDGKIYKNTVN